MKFIAIASSVLMLTFLSGQSFAASPLGYQPNDLAKLQKTGVCEHCDLSGVSVNFDSKFNEKPLDIAGSNFANSGISSLINREHQNSNFSGIIGTKSALYNLGLSGSSFKNALLLNSDFTYSNLSNTDFTGANVSGANFDNTTLVGSNISESQLKTVKSYCDAIMPDGSIHKC